MMDMIEVEKEIARATQQLRAERDAEREKVKELEAYARHERSLGAEQAILQLNACQQELAAAQATIAEMREALEEAVEDTLWIPKAKKILAIPTNQDALHEALARECERLAELARYVRVESGMLKAEAAAHRARKEQK